MMVYDQWVYVQCHLPPLIRPPTPRTPRTRAAARTAGAARLVLVLHQVRVPLIDLLCLAPHRVGLLGAIHVHGLQQCARVRYRMIFNIGYGELRASVFPTHFLDEKQSSEEIWMIIIDCECGLDIFERECE